MLRSLKSIAAALVTATLPSGAWAEAEIQMIINQSPWYSGFESTVKEYEAATGNKINIEAVPFPVLLEKSRNSVRAEEGVYDLLTINALGIIEMYDGGFLEAVTDIDPNYKLRDDISDFDGSLYWDEANKTVGNGKLMALPMAGIIQLLYYRADLYDEKGLSVPTTWDELLANAKALHNPPEMVGFTVRGSRQNIGWNAMPYIYSHGGTIFADELARDYTVTLNSPEALTAFTTFLSLAHDVGPDDPGTVGQAEMIQFMATGRSAHSIMVNAAWAGLENPSKSIVGGKIGVAEIPSIDGGQSYSSTGHFIGGIPKNIPEEKKQAALAFMKWLNTPEGQRAMVTNGSVPVSTALTASDFDDPVKFRHLGATARNSANALFYAAVPERNEINSIIDLYLNLAVVKEMSAVEALNKAAEEIHAVMVREGYKTGILPPLE